MPCSAAPWLWDPSEPGRLHWRFAMPINALLAVAGWAIVIEAVLGLWALV